jgi:hypothetical protein
MDLLGSAGTTDAHLFGVTSTELDGDPQTSPTLSKVRALIWPAAAHKLYDLTVCIHHRDYHEHYKGAK